MTFLASRRGFLAGLGSLVVAAPAVVRAELLMPVRSIERLVTPSLFVGQVMPIVGPIPDGWVECNGRWLCASSYSDLFATLGDRYGKGGGTFNLPDLRQRVASDQAQGRFVGRYVMYAGPQAEQRKHWLDGVTKGISVEQNFEPTIDDTLAMRRSWSGRGRFDAHLIIKAEGEPL